MFINQKGYFTLHITRYLPWDSKNMIEASLEEIPVLNDLVSAASLVSAEEEMLNAAANSEEENLLEEDSGAEILTDLDSAEEISQN